uniref:Uncharacterized protein n=1 Tax=Sipha flava TaxID=143950 RepID=A0A2S2PZ55_9HEMI
MGKIDGGIRTAEEEEDRGNSSQQPIIRNSSNSISQKEKKLKQLLRAPGADDYDDDDDDQDLAGLNVRKTYRETRSFGDGRVAAGRPTCVCVCVSAYSKPRKTHAHTRVPCMHTNKRFDFNC